MSSHPVLPRIAAFFACLAILLAPAMWNGFPFLFHDSGAYLDAFADWYLSPGRSALYGMLLFFGQWPDFWPAAILQAGLSIWVISLALRVFDLDRPLILVAIVALLSIFTALPWLAGYLMPDLFAGLAVIAVWLIVFHAGRFSRREYTCLIAFAAYAAAIHSASYAVLLALFAAAILAHFLLSRSVRIRLRGFATVLVLGAGLVFLTNFAVSIESAWPPNGQLTWTPGGTGFVFGRLVEDGIAERYLQEHCPDARLKLCEYRDGLTRPANHFLWDPASPFRKIGGFEGGAREMRAIILGSLRAYPLLHMKTAARATLRQLVHIETGDGIRNDVSFAYKQIAAHSPHALSHALQARQAKNSLSFDALNRLHVPAGLASILALFLFAAVSLVRKQSDELALMAMTFTLAILANAFVCGVFSNVQNRYGSRIAWLAVFFVAIVVLRRFSRRQPRPESSSTLPAP